MTIVFSVPLATLTDHTLGSFCSSPARVTVKQQLTLTPHSGPHPSAL
jgi:hypothetical protein